MKVLWATKKGEPDYMSEVITENESEIERAKQWAIDNGYDRFRVATYNDIPEAPDFVKTINI